MAGQGVGLLNVHALHRLLGVCWARYRAEGGSWAVFLPAAVLRRPVRGSEASQCRDSCAIACIDTLLIHF